MKAAARSGRARPFGGFRWLTLLLALGVISIGTLAAARRPAAGQWLAGWLHLSWLNQSGRSGMNEQPNPGGQNSARLAEFEAPITVSIDRSAPVAVSQLQLGVTHTQYSLDAFGNSAAVSRGMDLLRASTVFQNQHLMGWGADNPEPSPGAFDWTTLDARMATIRATGGTPVITLCCAPDWMKGGRAGQTDWSQLEAAPLPSHFDDFATLAAEVARRYPEVHYFVVWNEMKGFWNQAENRPDYEAYTDLYNKVYDHLKAVNPALQVGGPYVVMDSNPEHSLTHLSALSGAYGVIDQRSLDAVDYWLAHKHGAQFITLDVSTTGANAADSFTKLQKFSDVAAWVRQRTDLPLWLSEWFVTPWGDQEYDDDTQNAIMAATLMRFAMDGVSVALRWQPQGDASMSWNGDAESLWSDTRRPEGGQPYPFFYTARAFKQHFGRGTALYATSSSSAAVLALASNQEALLVNTTSQALAVTVGSVTGTLAPHEVRLVSLDNGVLAAVRQRFFGLGRR